MTVLKPSSPAALARSRRTANAGARVRAAAAGVSKIVGIDPSASNVGLSVLDARSVGSSVDPRSNRATFADRVVAFDVLHPGENLVAWAAHTFASDVAASIQPGESVHVVCEEPPKVVRAADFDGNTLRALVVQGQVGGVLTATVAAALRELGSQVTTSFVDSGIWRPLATQRLFAAGIPYGTGYPFAGEKPIVTYGNRAATYTWPGCGHSSPVGSSWCWECVPRKDARTAWKASAVSAAATLIPDRWDAFMAPRRARVRRTGLVRDFTISGAHDAAEALLIALSMVPL